ncbi:methyltransferase domain-containing protein (plasmid) [Streptomyces clavuligerus]|nr:methyltransferase domain-containing protein [Streptomyces clavuligerus]ANW22483.1 methyltransferase [Streptomyces clavuligerus]AXU17006.1 methyltransferase domain-containing protein [Streptomyces clavuligerus]AXU17386.1 methyltransferase domain-containing protein [Streptomyces clavuligerus]EDY52816.1 methyltransferase [Streptomyces clavuligerus]MBY6306952.1 methyltransferase domain-containing protein [Streptomyces clavuligerus]
MTAQQNEITPESVGQAYDRFADAGAATVLGGNLHVGHWDEDHPDVPVAEATDRLTDLVAERLALRPGRHLLDVGCGIGVPALRIAGAHGVRVTGVTVSTQQVAEATRRADRSGVRDQVSFRFADAMSLPFADGSFDDACAIEVLAHLADPAAALAEIRRVVRPGGRLVVSDLCQRQPFTGEGRAVLDEMLSMYEFAGIGSPGEHRAFLAGAGWEVLELTDIGERVRASYGHGAAAFRELARSLEGVAAEGMSRAAEVMEAFGRHPDTGYVLITAQRP